MDQPTTIYIGTAPAEAWRRVFYAACDDCDWRVAYRTYRSQRTAHGRRCRKAARIHMGDNPTHQARSGIGHA